MAVPQSLFVITGANRGFGRAIALALAANAKDAATTVMVLAGRHSEQLEQVGKEVESHGVNTWILSNVSLENAQAAQTSLLDRLEERITTSKTCLSRATLINNAGSTGDLSKTVDQYNPLEIQSYLDMNIASYATLVSGFVHMMRPKAKDQITIVNISSLLAVEPFRNWGLYATGKAARDMLLRVLAKENESVVRTLSYAPGPLDNEMQRSVRETLGDAEQKKLYTDMAVKGQLVSMADSARKLVQLLEKDDFPSGAHIDYYDS